MDKTSSSPRIEKVFLITLEFQPIDGVAEQVVLLAQGLHECGCEVWVFTQRPVDRSNQYVQRLHEASIPLVHPPRWVSLIEHLNWDRRDWAKRVVLRILYPLWVVVALLDALVRGRSIKRSWAGVLGFANGLLSLFFLPDYLYFYRILDVYVDKCQPDVVHIHRTSFIRAVRWCHKRGLCTVYTERGDPSNYGIWNAEAVEALYSADRVTVLSEAAKRGLIRSTGYKRSVDIIYSMVLDPKELDEAVSAVIDTDPIVVTYVGRLVKGKGVNYLLEAAANVLSLQPNVRFDIVGDGPARDQLVREAWELSIQSQVNFLGYIDNSLIPSILRSTSIFVLPSLSEGFGTVVVMAMASGVAIVTTTVGVSTEVLEHGVSGMLVPPGSPDELAAALKELIENPILRKEMGRKARMAYEQNNFTPKKIVPQVLRVYQRAKEAHKAGRK